MVAEAVTRAEFRKHAKSVDKRFEAVDKRFDAVDKRFDAVDKRFDAVDKRFGAMDKKFDDLVAVIGETIAKAVITIEHNLARRLREELGADLARQLRASEERLRDQLGRDMTTQILASEERIRGEIRGVDDQYRDLPERVAKLEVHTGLKR
jgi:septation ring formation regulator EzrA